MNSMTSRRSGASFRALSFVTVVALSASGVVWGEPGQTEATTEEAGAMVHAEHWPNVQWPLALDPDFEARIDALIEAMSLEQLVGQTIQADIASITPGQLRNYPLGSVLAGGNSSPGGRYNATPEEWLALVDDFWLASMEERSDGPAVPIIFGIDAVHGHNNVVGATIFPHNIGLGAARNPDLLREIGRVTAIEARTTGMEWTFAPSVAVPRDLRWGRTYEGYAEAPEVVARYAGELVEGLQGSVGSSDFLAPDRVVATAKHFLGDGGTEAGLDQGDTRAPESELSDIHAAGYPPSIASGVQSIMASFNSYHGRKLHGHKELLTNVLKEQMNFGGFIVGDWNGHGQVAGCTNTNCAQSINAGVDMFMAPDSWQGLFDNTLAQVKAGEIPMERLEDAVRRILRVKLRLNLFDVKPSERPISGQFELLGSAEHREVARRAVRESLVLLKNNTGILPLLPDQHILVAGDGADNIDKQTGGWTLTWQGTGTTREDYPNGETIWEGIREHVEASGGRAELAINGRFEQRPDAAIVVFGEEPYAEFQGDLKTLRYKPGDDSDLALLRRLQESGIPTVAIYVGGRPLWLNRELNASDAFVAAWLPGTEGGGIADVVFADLAGRARYDFSGQLSFSWPARADQYSLNVGQENYRPLFPYGFGLTYADDGDLGMLSENSGIESTGLATGLWFDRGRVDDRMQLRLVGSDGASQLVDQTTARSPDDNVELFAEDHLAQEDARRIHWSGSGRLELTAAEALDLDRQTNGDVFLTMTVQISSLPEEGGVRLTARCGEDCEGALEIGDQLDELSLGVWQTLGVSLKCLRERGADTASLTAPFVLESGAGLSLSITQIGLSTRMDHRLECTATP